MNPQIAPRFVAVLLALGFVALLGWNATVMFDAVVDRWNMKRGLIGGASFILVIDVALIGMIVFAGIAGTLKRRNKRSNQLVQTRTTSGPV